MGHWPPASVLGPRASGLGPRASVLGPPASGLRPEGKGQRWSGVKGPRTVAHAGWSMNPSGGWSMNPGSTAWRLGTTTGLSSALFGAHGQHDPGRCGWSSRPPLVRNTYVPLHSTVGGRSAPPRRGNSSSFPSSWPPQSHLTPPYSTSAFFLGR